MKLNKYINKLSPSFFIFTFFVVCFAGNVYPREWECDHKVNDRMSAPLGNAYVFKKTKLPGSVNLNIKQAQMYIDSIWQEGPMVIIRYTLTGSSKQAVSHARLRLNRFREDGSQTHYREALDLKFSGKEGRRSDYRFRLPAGRYEVTVEAGDENDEKISDIREAVQVFRVEGDYA